MTDLRAKLGAPAPDDLVDAPRPAKVVVQRDALAEARDRAVAAIRADLERYIADGAVTTTMNVGHLASLLTDMAVAAATIDADYVRGYRDAMTKVRRALGPIASVGADPFMATDGTEDATVAP